MCADEQARVAGGTPEGNPQRGWGERVSSSNGQLAKGNWRQEKRTLAKETRVGSK